MEFAEEILIWYQNNKRSLPWRNVGDPYKIWLSEIMLQQTRVAQGLPYYRKFLKHFPTVQELAAAPEKKVLKLWQGLGYYSRARNLHATAKYVINELDGCFPDTYEGLLRLKGIGDYTASALASICFGQAEPVVDGNVYRVLARYFGIWEAIDTGVGKRHFKNLAREVMARENPGEYNQAIMEFGALQCVPNSPDCSVCPLNSACMAFQKQEAQHLPVKRAKKTTRKRFFNYVVPVDNDHKTLVQRRDGRDIWQNLYEFPLVESNRRVSGDEMQELLPEILKAANPTDLQACNDTEIVYKLSHQHLHTRFWFLQLESPLEDGVSLEELDTLPVPVLIADFIKTLKNSYF